MAGTVQTPDASSEFWRPEHVQTAPAAPAALCQRCQTEFAQGARFCHVCGLERHAALRTFTLPKFRALVSLIQFPAIRTAIGLNPAALIAFAAGLVCLLCALGIGLIYKAQTTLDWQAIQLWRMEWLLAAIAAFVAGILLRKPASGK